MKIKNKSSRRVMQFNLSEMQDCDCCCSSWPRREGVVEFHNEKFYLVEYQDLRPEATGCKVFVMGYFMERGAAKGVKEYISIHPEDLTPEERSELVLKIKNSGFDGEVSFAR